MTQQKVEKMCEDMRQAIGKRIFWAQLEPFRFDSFPKAFEDQAKHILFMIQSIPEFHSHPERREKAHRWIGFVQGWLCVTQTATLEELKRMNMPEQAEYSPERL